jgi:hypothetical protein
LRRLVVLVVALWALPAEAAGAWSWPVDGPVLRPFVLGDDPYAGGQHRGIDIAADPDAPVRAPVGGEVSFAGTVPGGGRTITIRTADGYSATLLHLGPLSVRRGDAVAERDVVAAVGPSGEPEWDRPYVHLGVRVTADPHGYVDPLLFLPVRPEAATALPTARAPVPAGAEGDGNAHGPRAVSADGAPPAARSAEPPASEAPVTPPAPATSASPPPANPVAETADSVTPPVEQPVAEPAPATAAPLPAGPVTATADPPRTTDGRPPERLPASTATPSSVAPPVPVEPADVPVGGEPALPTGPPTQPVATLPGPAPAAAASPHGASRALAPSNPVVIPAPSPAVVAPLPEAALPPPVQAPGDRPTPTPVVTPPTAPPEVPSPVASGTGLGDPRPSPTPVEASPEPVAAATPIAPEPDSEPAAVVAPDVTLESRPATTDPVDLVGVDGVAVAPGTARPLAVERRAVEPAVPPRASSPSRADGTSYRDAPASGSGEPFDRLVAAPTFGAVAPAETAAVVPAEAIGRVPGETATSEADDRVGRPAPMFDAIRPRDGEWPAGGRVASPASDESARAGRTLDPSWVAIALLAAIAGATFAGAARPHRRVVAAEPSSMPTAPCSSRPRRRSTRRCGEGAGADADPIAALLRPPRRRPAPRRPAPSRPGRRVVTTRRVPVGALVA